MCYKLIEPTPFYHCSTGCCLTFLMKQAWQVKSEIYLRSYTFQTNHSYDTSFNMPNLALMMVKDSTLLLQQNYQFYSSGQLSKQSAKYLVQTGTIITMKNMMITSNVGKYQIPNTPIASELLHQTRLPSSKKALARFLSTNYNYIGRFLRLKSNMNNYLMPDFGY